MGLIIYPADLWQSFTTVLEADLIISTFVESEGKAVWGSYTDDAPKEAILAQTGLQIKLCPGIKLPDAVTTDLELAQCYLVIHALTTDMLSFDANSKAISEEHAGAVGVSYDTSLKADDNMTFDPMTQALLRQYGCSSSNSGFSQSYLGRS